MKRFCFLLIFSLIEITIQAASNIRITPVPSLPQLPVSAIHRIFQDSEGLMWYGTVNGLCCDDGYQINVIRSDINTPGLLNDNTIQSLPKMKGEESGLEPTMEPTCWTKPADRLHRWRLNGYRQVLSTAYERHPTELCG